jgi:hypothetical protein
LSFSVCGYVLEDLVHDFRRKSDGIGSWGEQFIGLAVKRRKRGRFTHDHGNGVQVADRFPTPTGGGLKFEI